MIINHHQNILTHFQEIVEVFFTTSQTKVDYYYQKNNVKAAARLTQQLTTYKVVPMEPLKCMVYSVQDGIAVLQPDPRNMQKKIILQFTTVNTVEEMLLTRVAYDFHLVLHYHYM